MRILIIEDDKGISNALKELLSGFGYAVDISANLQQADLMLSAENFDMILLDLTLPDGDGSKLLKTVRSNKNHLNSQTPVLVITACDAIISMVTNLDLGADDYLVKPFKFEVLIARIRAIIRCAKGFSAPNITYKDLNLCLTKRKTYQNGKLVDLSVKEFFLLQKFIQNPGNVFTRTQLEQALYNFEILVESNAIEVHIHNLRKNIIKTVRGIGYFAPED